MTDLDDIHQMIVGREEELHAEVLQEYSHCQGRSSDLKKRGNMYLLVYSIPSLQALV